MDEFKCKRCGHQASSLWNLKSHLNRATPCLDINLCGKSQDELLKDITVDKTDWEFECNSCGAKYRSKQGLNFHIRNKKCPPSASPLRIEVASLEGGLPLPDDAFPAARTTRQAGSALHGPGEAAKVINYNQDVSHPVGSHNTPIRTNPVVMIVGREKIMSFLSYTFNLTYI